MSPDYTTRDLFGYGGFIGGIATFMVSTQAWDVHYLLRLFCGAVAGFALGGVMTQIYDRVNRHFSEPEPPDDDEDPFGA